MIAIAITFFAVHSILTSAQEDFEDFDDFEKEIIEGEEEFLVEDRAGITPDSPLYVFDKIVDNIQLRTSQGEEKTKKH